MPKRFWKTDSDSDSADVMVRVGNSYSVCNECQLQYTASLTPTLASELSTMQATAESGDSVDFVLVGTGLVSGGRPPNVTVGGALATVTYYNVSGETVEGTVTGVPAGVHEVKVDVAGSGFALADGTENLVLTVDLALSSVTPAAGSIAGGTVLTVHGAGFDASDVPGVNVSVCGVPCPVVAVAADAVECVTPQRVTAETNAQYHLVEEGALLTAGQIDYPSDVGSDHPPGHAFDGDVENMFRGRDYIGRKLEAGYVATLSRYRVYPASRQVYSDSGTASSTIRLEDAKLQGSNDSVTWTVLHTVSDDPDEGWNEYMVDSALSFRYLRLTCAWICGIGELELYGTLYTNMSSTCDVRVHVGEEASETAMLSTAFEYAEASTPSITSITPSMGTTGGGTSLTIHGTGFEADSNIQVLVDGVECANVQPYSGSVVCTTGERPWHVESSLVVDVAGVGVAATNGLVYTYIDRWSANTTWGGGDPPVEGDSVVIPAGKNILLDVSPPQLVLIIVEGRLEFEDAGDLELHAEYIFVRGGHLVVGTEDEPFTHQATITMHGQPYVTPELPTYGAKCIAVRRGAVDLHGVPKLPPWTQLSATVEAGASSMEVAAEVNWAPGDVVVLASTEFNMEQAETVTVTAVSQNSAGGSTVEFEPALTYKHFGEILTYDSKSIDMRGEVGVISRTVKLQGDGDSLRLQWGAHIFMHSPDGADSTIGRLSHVECQHCGQAFQLGRYPFHFHMIGAQHKSYVQGCAIHHTFNRAITVHGAHYLRILDNIGYDTMGHTFFIEGNLGLVTRKSFSLLDTDTTPATFWITNPTNYFRNNAAAGSSRYGFWFDLDPYPNGPSATKDVCPNASPLGEFSNNRAHSNARYALRLFHSYHPKEDPCNSNSPTIPAVFQDFTAFKNTRSGVIGSDIGHVRFEGFRLADNQRAGIEITDCLTQLGEAGSWDTLLVAHSTNQEWPMPQEDNPSSPRVTGIFGAQSENVTHHDTLFVNFNQPKGGEAHTAALSSCNHCDFPNTMCSGGKTVHLSASSWMDSPVRVDWGLPYKGIFHDVDGTLGAGAAGSHVSARWPHLEDGCEAAPEEFPDSLVCAPEVAGPKRLEVNKMQPFYTLRYQKLRIAALSEEDIAAMEDYSDVEAWPNVNASAALSWSSVPYKDNMWHEPDDGWAIALLHGHTYALHAAADHAVDMYEVRLKVQHLQPGEYVYLKINYTTPYDHWKVTVDGVEMRSSLVEEPASSGTTGESYLDKYNQVLTVLFSGTGQEGRGTYQSQTVSLEADMCPRTGCPAPPTISAEKEPFTRKWSNASQWPNGRVPADGDYVTVEAAWRLWLDVQPASLGQLAIDGELHFDEEVCGITLEVVNIVVGGTGELHIGSATSPYMCQAAVRLSGDRSSPWLAIADVDIGNKALANFGVVEIHGIPRLETRAMLGAVASKGASQVVVDRSVDWQIGESILITSSSFDQTEAEVFAIVAKDGQALTLDGTLAHAHFGAPAAPVAPAKGRVVEVRAEVALLSRNVVVEGSQNNDEHGCHFLTSSFTADDGSTVEGMVTLSNMLVRNCGQYGTHHHALSLKAPRAGMNSIQGCAVWDSHNNGIFLLQASGTVVTSNTIYSSRGSSVDIDESDSVVLTGNMAAYTKARSQGRDLLEVLANFDVCTRDEDAKGTRYCQSVEVHDNVAAGSSHFGFLHRAEACDTPSGTGYELSSGAFAARLFRGNRAHSTPNGVWILPGESSACSYLSDMTVHHTTEVGVFYGQNLRRLELEHLTLADNHIALYISPVQASEGNQVEMAVKDVVLVGHSGNTVAMELEAGRCPSPRSGVMPFIISEGWPLPRSEPLMLYDDAIMDGGWGGTLHLHDLELANWTLPDACAEGDAKRTGAIATNPKAPDSLSTVFIKGVTGSSPGAPGFVWMDFPNPKWQNPDDCVDADCTGLLNVVIHDEDGSLTGSIGQIYGKNALVGGADADCTYRTNWGAYSCAGTSYDTLYVESLDSDRYSRRFTPVTFWSEATGLVNSVFPQMDHRWDQGYTSNLRLTRFPVLLDLGKAYNVTCTGTNPRDMHFALTTDFDDKGVLLHIWYQSPELHEVSVDGKLIQPMEAGTTPPWDMVSISDPPGTHYWYNKQRILTLLVKGTSDVLVRTVNAVQLDLTVIGSIDEFYDNGGIEVFTANLAYSLSIDPRRIKVVDIVSGVARRRRRSLLAETNTTQLEVMIVENKTAVTATSGVNETNPDAVQNATVAELERVAALAENQATNNALLSDFTVSTYTESAFDM
eukprot:gene5436-6591_t